jgi:hypothetical protein
MASHRSVSASHVEIRMDEVGAGVASWRPVASCHCLPSGCNCGGAVLEQRWSPISVSHPLQFLVRSCAMQLSGAGLGSVVGGAGSNQPMNTGWVQPPHKIHLGAE